MNNVEFMAPETKATIARAIYENKDILILDEATSALDLDTEKLFIQNQMRRK